MSAPATAVPTTIAPHPLSPDQAQVLDRLTGGLDANGLWWLSGYMAGLARSHAAPSLAVAADVAPVPATAPLTVVYGSQTGNAKRLAEKLARQLEAGAVPVRLLRADSYPVRELKDERRLYLVISTQGDGEPPDDARGLVEFIAGRRAPGLEQLQFGVLALGDSSYPQFCAIGRRLDARLAELGARRLFELGEADLDIDSVATPWLERAVRTAVEATDVAPARQPGATVTPLRPATPAFDRERPFAATVLGNQPLTASAGRRHRSDRDIRHLELSLEGANLPYEPGDALGVWPRNPPALVDAVLASLGLPADAPVKHGDEEHPLHHWLEHKRELTRLTRPFLARHAERARDATLSDADTAAVTALLERDQLIDLLRAHPAGWEPGALVAALRPLTPRLYSIASSRKHVGDEAHLTVAHVQCTRDGESRWGAASHLLAGSGPDASVPVFIEHNERFRLPADASRDIVMIGPGTGVAPFRGFAQERAAIGAGGRNWLLFGNPHLRTDFLYQTEWQQALRDGRLHRLDLAFSRDQAEKVYVQHRLREHGRELYAWLEGGAHLYVCGDASRMARDVHAALVEVIATHGAMAPEDAEAHLHLLQQQGRYARDVY
ncbi:NADP oxidoreductase [Lysobacter arseniciresistens ZS79]|uniref:Sulfite reductase [NADPH] flavoprotein alpha-component n=1 Tax=Lysobacter arseniciresistens ZS79 TaxID=913325 RepID=A0A0A0F299_9GAMM|nr:assimilatory sulfite reductase (NADPH) flavoprotein subunit [Lysobacter arseniciresistens]KGM56914.1 NADP oxidoreductase [Lysobacter arseniciresistens ZS79]